MAYHLHVSSEHIWIVPNLDHPVHIADEGYPSSFVFNSPVGEPNYDDPLYNHGGHMLYIHRPTQSLYIVDRETGEIVIDPYIARQFPMDPTALTHILPNILKNLPSISSVNIGGRQRSVFPLPEDHVTAITPIEAILGAISLVRGMYLIFATGSTPVGLIAEHMVRGVTGTYMLCVSPNRARFDLNYNQSLVREEAHVANAISEHLESLCHQKHHDGVVASISCGDVESDDNAGGKYNIAQNELVSSKLVGSGGGMLFSRRIDISLPLQKIYDFATVTANHLIDSEKSSTDTSTSTSTSTSVTTPDSLSSVLAAPHLSPLAFASDLISRSSDSTAHTRPHLASLYLWLSRTYHMLLTCKPSWDQYAIAMRWNKLTFAKAMSMFTLHASKNLDDPVLDPYKHFFPDRLLNDPPNPNSSFPSALAPFLIVPVVGSLHTHASIEKGELLVMTSITRISRFRAGPALFNRGVDLNSKTSLAEVEQILSRYSALHSQNDGHNDGDSDGDSDEDDLPSLRLVSISSHLTLRGVPFVEFSQTPSYSLVAPSPLSLPSPSQRYLHRQPIYHLSGLLRSYHPPFVLTGLFRRRAVWSRNEKVLTQYLLWKYMSGNQTGKTHRLTNGVLTTDSIDLDLTKATSPDSSSLTKSKTSKSEKYACKPSALSTSRKVTVFSRTDAVDCGGWWESEMEINRQRAYMWCLDKTGQGNDLVEAGLSTHGDLCGGVFCGRVPDRYSDMLTGQPLLRTISLLSNSTDTGLDVFTASYSPNNPLSIIKDITGVACRTVETVLGFNSNCGVERELNRLADTTVNMHNHQTLHSIANTTREDDDIYAVDPIFNPVLPGPFSYASEPTPPVTFSTLPFDRSDSSYLTRASAYIAFLVASGGISNFTFTEDDSDVVIPSENHKSCLSSLSLSDLPSLLSQLPPMSSTVVNVARQSCIARVHSLDGLDRVADFLTIQSVHVAKMLLMGVYSHPASPSSTSISSSVKSITQSRLLFSLNALYNRVGSLPSSLFAASLLHSRCMNDAVSITYSDTLALTSLTASQTHEITCDKGVDRGVSDMDFHRDRGTILPYIHPLTESSFNESSTSPSHSLSLTGINKNSLNYTDYLYHSHYQPSLAVCNDNSRVIISHSPSNSPSTSDSLTDSTSESTDSNILQRDLPSSTRMIISVCSLPLTVCTTLFNMGSSLLVKIFSLLSRTPSTLLLRRQKEHTIAEQHDGYILFSTQYKPVRHLMPWIGYQVVKVQEELSSTDQTQNPSQNVEDRYELLPLEQSPVHTHIGSIVPIICVLVCFFLSVAITYFLIPLIPIPDFRDDTIYHHNIKVRDSAHSSNLPDSVKQYPHNQHLLSSHQDFLDLPSSVSETSLTNWVYRWLSPAPETPLHIQECSITALGDYEANLESNMHRYVSQRFSGDTQSNYVVNVDVESELKSGVWGEQSIYLQAIHTTHNTSQSSSQPDIDKVSELVASRLAANTPLKQHIHPDLHRSLDSIADIKYLRHRLTRHQLHHRVDHHTLDIVRHLSPNCGITSIVPLHNASSQSKMMVVNAVPQTYRLVVFNWGWNSLCVVFALFLAGQWVMWTYLLGNKLVVKSRFTPNLLTKPYDFSPPMVKYI